MTFINRRIIKRPTLFATSRRNFGNLLTHIETGQDGTTPEPGPDPDPTTPISFTVSWATNGGIIQANLAGIQSGLTINADLSSITGAHPDFYAYLCRDDETTLATYHFQTGQTTASLSFTETDYGTFTYQLKLGTTEV